MKQTIRLNENQFNRLVKKIVEESVKKVLNEGLVVIPRFEYYYKNIVPVSTDGFVQEDSELQIEFFKQNENERTEGKGYTPKGYYSTAQITPPVSKRFKMAYSYLGNDRYSSREIQEICNNIQENTPKIMMLWNGGKYDEINKLFDSFRINPDVLTLRSFGTNAFVTKDGKTKIELPKESSKAIARRNKAVHGN